MIEPYADLRVTFSQASGGAEDAYRVTATIDDGPAVASDFLLPMSRASILAKVRAIAVTRSSAATYPGTRVGRVVDDEPPADDFTLGEGLATALFTPGIETMVNQARERGRFRLALNFTNAPELLQIPWELLRWNGWDLASHTDSTIVRELDTNERLKPQPVQGRLKMLVVIANPRGDLDVKGEEHKITEALSGVGSSQAAQNRKTDTEREVEIRFLPNCTYTDLQRALQHDQYHILHFAGHSAAAANGKTTILLTGEDGAEQAIEGNTIAQLIGGHRSLQLVVFNSCEGARTAEDDAFSGFATMLVQQGMSAVIAMQFEIGDAAAKAFAGELYYALVQLRYPIDAAVAEARKAIYPVSPAEFSTPVLFLRSGRADLFDFVHSTSQAPPATTGSGQRRWRAILAAAAAVAAVVAGGTFLATRPDTAATDASTIDRAADASSSTERSSYGGFDRMTEVYAITEWCLMTDLFSPGPETALLALDFQTSDSQLFLCDQAWAGLDDRGGPTGELKDSIDQRLDDALRVLDAAGGSGQAANAYEQGGAGLRERLLAELDDLRVADAGLDEGNNLEVYGEFFAVTDVLAATERCLRTDLFSPGSASLLLDLPDETIDLVTFLCDQASNGVIDVGDSGRELADALRSRVDSALAIHDAGGGSAQDADQYEVGGEGLRAELLGKVDALRALEADG